MKPACPEELENPTQNLFAFSVFYGNTFKVDKNLLYIHIICSVSIALSLKPDARKDIEILYGEDALTYTQTASSSECYNHILLHQGCLETELSAVKAVGILLVSEDKPLLQKKIIDLLKIHFPNVYKTTKKHNFKYLLSDYATVSDFLNSEEAKYDRAVYFYLSFYCSPDWVDKKTINGIAQSIYNFEKYSPIHADILKETAKASKAITRLKDAMTQKYQNPGSYMDILKHSNPEISGFGTVVENLFYINKLDLDDIYYNYHQLSMDEIYLAIIKQKRYAFDSAQNLYLLLACIFIHPLLIQYKETKKYIKEQIQDNDLHYITRAEKSIAGLKAENQNLLDEIKILREESNNFNNLITQSLTNQKKDYEAEIALLNRTIKDLNQQLLHGSDYRQELNKLREFIFNLDIQPSYPEEGTAPITDIIKDKSIIIIGGPRHWRRKLREHLPTVITLSGTSTSLDLTYFEHIDCVLFYTNYMSHAIYNKAMNFIRTKHIKFGYLKSTNLSLLEAEMFEVLKQCDVI